MHHLLIATALATVSLGTCSAAAIAQDSARSALLTEQLVQAHLEWHVARQRLIEYRRVVLPQQRRGLDDAAQMLNAEEYVLHRRLKDYRPFLAVGDYSPVRTAAERHALALLATQYAQRHVQDERIALMRFSYQHDQLYQLELLRAALRVQAIQNALAEVTE